MILKAGSVFSASKYWGVFSMPKVHASHLYFQPCTLHFIPSLLAWGCSLSGIYWDSLYKNSSFFSLFFLRKCHFIFDIRHNKYYATSSPAVSRWIARGGRGWGLDILNFLLLILHDILLFTFFLHTIIVYLQLNTQNGSVSIVHISTMLTVDYLRLVLVYSVVQCKGFSV